MTCALIFKVRGPKLCYIYYLPEAPPGGARGDFIFWFSRNQENAFLDAFQRILFLCHNCLFVQQKCRGAMVHPPPPGCVGPMAILSLYDIFTASFGKLFYIRGLMDLRLLGPNAL